MARLAYGKALINARAYLLNAIPAGAQILIIGGGTGWELEQLSKKYPSGLEITYVDSSAKMIALAAVRNTAANKIIFINEQAEHANIEGLFDVIMTPFLFDNFTEDGLATLFSILDSHLRTKGLWLHCDFINSNVFWQKALLKLMYLFFRVSCGIKAQKLPDTEACFAQYDYSIVAQKYFLRQFIRSVHYQKDT